MPKIQPAVMNLTFRTTATDNWIDISQAASIVNRRFYRQGLNWAVSGITIQMLGTGTITGNVRVETLPTTWVCSNAWHKTFLAWKRQQDEALEDSGSEDAKARFNDFKIFMDPEHVSDYVSSGGGTPDLNDTNLIPLYGGTANEFDTGEWQPSSIVIPNAAADGTGSLTEPVERLLHMVGENSPAAGTSKGIIDGYAYSRNYPQSPDPVDPGLDSFRNFMGRMFSVGNDNPEVLGNATNTNDELPYDQDEYPGGEGNAPGLQLLAAHKVTQTTVSNRFNIRGSNVPCGLLKVTNDTGTEAEVMIHLVPGNHRGYLAEPMQDM